MKRLFLFLLLFVLVGCNLNPETNLSPSEIDKHTLEQAASMTSQPMSTLTPTVTLNLLLSDTPTPTRTNTPTRTPTNTATPTPEKLAYTVIQASNIQQLTLLKTLAFGHVYEVHYSQDGSTIILQTNKNTCLLDANTLAIHRCVDHPQDNYGHYYFYGQLITSNTTYLTSDLKQLITFSDSSVTVIDMESGKRIKSFETTEIAANTFNFPRFSPSGSTMAVVTHDRGTNLPTTEIWSLDPRYQ